ncbi:hypothetical protein GCM10023259_100460 [Thermocatellispora tengchongensis]
MIASTFATLLASAALVVATASGASATPADCTYQISGQTASSFCASGTGEHRVRVVLRHFNPEIGLIPITSPWAPVGSVSSTGMPPHQIVSVWVETRG